MDILSELWTGNYESDKVKNSYQYVVDLRDRIEKTCHIAQEELSKAQKRYRKNYNRRARVRRFRKGDSVLILLPTDSNKLLMQWKGPYEIDEVVSDYNYRVKVRGKIKTYHANLLKEYFHRKTGGIERLGASVIECNDPDDIALELAEFGKEETYKDVKINQNLTQGQIKELETLIENSEKFSQISQETLGWSNIISGSHVLNQLGLGRILHRTVCGR